jgi:SAM-dependent methyltransferase
MRMLRRYVPHLGGKSVVELGGGSSYRLLSLAKWGNARVVAVDFSTDGLDTVQAIFAANGQSVQPVLADVLAWDVAEQRFDLIVHWGLLEHFADPNPLIRKCADLLAPGGTLLFTMPNMEAFGAHLWRRFAPVNWSHHVFHSDDAVRAACITSGLVLERCFHFGYPMIHVTDWESGGTLHRLGSGLMSKLAMLAAAPALFLPVYQWGWRRLSVERGFVARRA